MKEFSVSMALVDLIPVIFYLAAGCIVFKDLGKKFNLVSRITYGSGMILVSAASFIKALYKLLYALKVGDFLWMSNQFFSNQSIGFLLTGIGMLVYVLGRGKKTLALLPTMALVGIMVAGLACTDAAYITIAAKSKKGSAIVCFIFSFILCMAMGYLSTKDFSQSYMNWVAQIINCVGQVLLFLGVRILHKNSLAK